MRSSGRRARVAVATIAIWLSVCTAAAAQTARERYEAAVERDEQGPRAAEQRRRTGRPPPDLLARAQAGDARRSRSIVRRFPTSGYADNALFQAASLADAAYERFSRAEDRDRARRSSIAGSCRSTRRSTLVKRANAKLDRPRRRRRLDANRRASARRDIQRDGDGRIACRVHARSSIGRSRYREERLTGPGARVLRPAERATDAGADRQGADLPQRRRQQDPRRPPSRSRRARRPRSRRRRQVQRVHARTTRSAS